MGSCNLDIGLSVSDFLTDLVIDTASHELSERACERNLSGDCETGSSAYHIGLCNTALDEPFREFIGESIHLEGAFQVCGKCNYSGISLSSLIQSGTETASGIFLTCICIFCHDISVLIVSQCFFQLSKCLFALVL